MGVSTDAILAWGVPLGGPDEDWTVSFRDGTYDGPAWFDPAKRDEDGEYFEEQANERLRPHFLHTAFNPHVLTFQSGTYPQYFLATWSASAYRGQVRTLDLARVVAQPEAEYWAAALVTAASVLQIVGDVGTPAFTLLSYWGQ